MDEKLRASLVIKLSADKKFDSAYTTENRKWFVGAVLDALAITTPDSDLEGKARDVISKSCKILDASREFKVGIALDQATEWFERGDVARRVETIYGVIASNPALAEEANDALREFIIRRRYRTALRMIYYVNPNENGYFFYPYNCKLPPTDSRPAWRVNVESKDLWERASTRMVPLRVRVPSGTTPDPKKAAAALWNAHSDPCDANLFDCGHAASCVLMDSLFEADRSDLFFKSIHSRGPDHLLIVDPFMFKEQHYLWERDSEPRRVFSKEKVSPKDFQIGDHVFIWNHGLYPKLVPGGFWSGEHAIVVNCGNRNLADGKGFLFSGHGLKNNLDTVEALHDDLVKTLQTGLHRAYSIGKAFLNYRRSNNTSIPSVKVQTAPPFKMKDRSNNDVDVFAYAVNVEFEYGNYRVEVAPGAKVPMVTEPGFIVFEVPSLKAVGISPPGVYTVAEQQEKGMDKLTVLQRTGTPGAGGNIYDRQLWEIPYRDSDTDTEKHFPLFGGPRGSLRLLERREMPKFKFGRLSATDVGALTTRPTSDASPSYVSFLRSCGALPP